MARPKSSETPGPGSRGGRGGPEGSQGSENKPAVTSRERNFRTASGLPRERVYGPNDLPASEEIGEPGTYPFTRGLYPDGYRARYWTMRQYAGFATARE